MRYIIIFAVLSIPVLISCPSPIQQQKRIVAGGVSQLICDFNNQADCEGSFLRCLWSPVPNSSGQQCFSKDVCGTDRPREICTREYGCVYNDDKNRSYCLSPKTSPCRWATTQESCHEIWQCIWSQEGKTDSSGETQHCFGTLPMPLIGYKCGDYPKDICTTTGCIYDETNSKCLSRRISSCDEFSNEAHCDGAGCLWENSVQQCLSVMPISTRCDHFTEYGKETCEKAGCLYDELANPRVCVSKYVGCGEYDPQVDSCPISFGCRISTDGTQCESTNCNFNISKADCETQPGCRWDTFCRNP